MYLAPYDMHGPMYGSLLQYMQCLGWGALIDAILGTL
jgi:hypothetical protein